jgi:hypothetical protein
MTSITSDPQIANAPLRHAPRQTPVATGPAGATGNGGAAAPMRMTVARSADTSSSSPAASADAAGVGPSRLNLVV